MPTLLELGHELAVEEMKRAPPIVTDNYEANVGHVEMLLQVCPPADHSQTGRTNDRRYVLICAALCTVGQRRVRPMASHHKCHAAHLAGRRVRLLRERHPRPDGRAAATDCAAAVRAAADRAAAVHTAADRAAADRTADRAAADRAAADRAAADHTLQQPTTQPSAQPSSAPAPAPSSSTEPSHPKNYEGKPANRPELYDASGKYDRNATLEIARAARSDKVKGVPRSCDTSFSLEGLRLKIEANSGKTEGLLMAYGALGVSSAVEILGGMEFDGVTYTCPCAKVRCNSKSLCAPKSHLAVPVPRMPKRSAGRTTDASLTSTRSPTSIWCAASS